MRAVDEFLDSFSDFDIKRLWPIPVSVLIFLGFISMNSGGGAVPSVSGASVPPKIKEISTLSAPLAAKELKPVPVAKIIKVNGIWWSPRLIPGYPCPSVQITNGVFGPGQLNTENEKELRKQLTDWGLTRGSPMYAKEGDCLSSTRLCCRGDGKWR